MPHARRIPPIWLLGLTNSTFGLYSGIVGFTLPQLLSEQHVPEARIAAITALVFTPYFWSFLFSPVLDVRFSRRSYATALALLTAICLCVALINLHHLALFEAFLIAGVAASNLFQGALFGWLSSVLPGQDDTRLSAWLSVANIGGAGVMVILAGELIQRLPLTLAAILLGLAVLLPLVIFPFIPAPGPDRRLAKESFTGFFREIGTLLGRREVLIALALFLAPSGSFALANVVGGLGGIYHVSVHTVSLIGGIGVVIAGLGGSLIYPTFARRLSLRPLYLVIGIIGACFTLSLIFLPHTPAFFAVAMLGENAFQSLAFTGAFAIQFEAIGEHNPLAATSFSVMGAAVNFSVSYMLAIDGRAFGSHGLAGAYATDAILGIIVCLLLALLLKLTRRPRRAVLTEVA